MTPQEKLDAQYQRLRQCVLDEEELPGEPTDAMVRQFRRVGLVEFSRSIVRATKHGILERMEKV
ncbi:MAG: hypothetical protein ACPGYT_11860 [Nitrospirales bacterium]